MEGEGYMAVLFIEYPKCTTCKKAKKWLDEHGVEYVDRHIVEDNPTAAELAEWHERSGLPLRRFFNTSGMKSVSYTHLDVYKRQQQGRSGRLHLSVLSWTRAVEGCLPGLMSACPAYHLVDK